MPAEITAQDILDLRAEAAEAGDLDMVRICDQALDTSDPEMYEAREECTRAIQGAKAQDGNGIERTSDPRRA
jgi:hypothetical protein